MKRVLTISAIIALFTAFALAGESPLFKFDHESNGVNENNEVLVGIDHPSRVGSQKGASLSDQHFLFDKQHEQEINWSTGIRADAVGKTQQLRLCNRAGTRVPTGVWAPERHGTAPGSLQIRNAWVPAETHALESQRTAIQPKLTHATHCISVEANLQADQTAASSASRLEPQKGQRRGPAEILQVAVASGSQTAGYGHSCLPGHNEAFGLQLHHGQEGLARSDGSKFVGSFSAHETAFRYVDPPKWGNSLCPASRRARGLPADGVRSCQVRVAGAVAGGGLAARTAETETETGQKGCVSDAERKHFTPADEGGPGRMESAQAGWSNWNCTADVSPHPFQPGESLHLASEDRIGCVPAYQVIHGFTREVLA